MRKSISDDYCSEDARLDAVRKTETASTATNNQGKDVAYENLCRKKYKVLKNMTTEKPEKKKKKKKNQSGCVVGAKFGPN